MRVRLCTLRLPNPGRFLALSSSSNLSLTPSSWAGAHQIRWLPFIALSLIGIILGEEITVSHPRLPHGQRDRPGQACSHGGVERGSRGASYDLGGIFGEVGLLCRVKKLFETSHLHRFTPETVGPEAAMPPG